MTGIKTPSSACTRRTDEFSTDGNTSARWPEQVRRRGGGGGAWRRLAAATCVTLNGSGIQLAVGPQPLWLRNHNFGLAQRIMVKRLATSPHDPLGITDSACKNQLVMVSVQYGPFNTYIPIRSTTIDSIGYPRMKANGESSTTKHRLLHASGPHPIPPPNDPKTNQYNQDLGLFHSTNGNHLESPNEGSSIDHQVTIHLHALNITMFPTNETCRRRRRPPCAAAARLGRKIVSDQLDEENPFVQNSSVLLVQADEGVSVLVVDRIGVIYRNLPRSNSTRRIRSCRIRQCF
ncbi:hypothetical protein F511_24633 [Dorcoceras hygrometricum]|uniref:Uncharacterized protein n=1 Tax=Dorcoceras hygrometricum TaxID=472368 RepID=A0A2Z7BBL4_9LAMI|nr:hypothetical protein F511_24633 [Dorcoceras hygrometricum]